MAGLAALLVFDRDLDHVFALLSTAGLPANEAIEVVDAHTVGALDEVEAEAAVELVLRKAGVAIAAMTPTMSTTIITSINETPLCEWLRSVEPTVLCCFACSY